MVDLKDKYFILMVILGLVNTLIVANVIGEFKQLPSPLFGGDYYFQLGGVYQVYNSSPIDWFKSSNMLGELPAYLPSYAIVTTVFGKIFAFQPMQAMLYVNYILPFISVFIFFFLIKKWIGSSELALLGTAALVTYQQFPILKYTDFTSMIIVPIFFLSILLFLKERNQKNALTLGLAYALMALSHSTSFMYASFVICALFLYLLLTDDTKEFNIRIMKFAPYFILSFGIGFLIAQILWFEPIFIYHGAAPLKNSIWSLPDIARLDVGFDLALSQLKAMFFNTTSVFWFILSIFSLGGVWMLVSDWRKKPETEYRTYVFLFIVTFVFVYSYLILAPLFDMHLIPSYSQPMYLSKIALIGGLLFFRDKFSTSNYRVYIIAILALSYLWMEYSGYSTWYSQQWFQVGRSSLYPAYSELQNYLLKNTDINDVFLSTNELSFGLNGLSGRKLVISRRSQNDPFMDFDRRQLDAAIILYGKNGDTRTELMKKYGVKYVYYDPQWYSFDYSFDDKGNLLGYSDPIMVFYSEKNAKELSENGISFVKINGWVDPAMRGGEYRTYDLLLVSPDNYDDKGKGPWNDGIDYLLSPVWSYSKDGFNAILYKVDYN